MSGRLSCLRRFPWMDISFDPACHRPRGYIEIVRRLEIHPELRCHGEIAGESQCSISRDAAAPIDDLAHAGDGHAEVASETVDAQPERPHEILPQNLAWVHWRKPARSWHHSSPSLVIVDDLHVVGIDVVRQEADAVLIVDANAVLPATIARKCLEPVARKRRQIP